MASSIVTVTHSTDQQKCEQDVRMHVLQCVGPSATSLYKLSMLAIDYT